MKRIVLIFIVLCILLLPGASAATQRIAYWNFADLTSFEGQTATKGAQAFNASIFPTFAVSGDSSPSSLNFTGVTNSLVQIDNSSLCEVSSAQNRSFSVWAKFTDAASTQYLLECGIDGGAGQFAGWSLFYQPGSGDFPGTNRIGVQALSSAVSYTVSTEPSFFNITDWNNYVVTFRAQSGQSNISFYINGQYVGYVMTPNLPYDGHYMYGLYFDDGSQSQFMRGYVDEVRIYNDTLSLSETISIYETGGIAGEDVFVMTARNAWNNSVITTFNATMILPNGSSYLYSTTDGVLNTQINISTAVNITVNVSGYLTHTFTDVNTSSAFVAYLNQSRILITAREQISQSPIPDFMLSYGNQTYQSSAGQIILGINAGTYTFNTTSAGYISSNLNFTVMAALNESSQNAIAEFYSVILNMTALNYTGQPLQVFNVSVIALNYSYNVSLNTSAGNILYPTISGLYNVTFSAAGFFNRSTMVNATNGTYPIMLSLQPRGIDIAQCGGIYNFTLITFNGKDEQTDLALNFSMQFSIFFPESITNTSLNFSLSGNSTYSICGLFNTTYVINPILIQYTSQNYSVKTYYILDPTLSGGKVVDLYLLEEALSSQIRLLVYDARTILPIQGAYIFVKRYFPGEGISRTIEIVRTDAEGSSAGSFYLATGLYNFEIRYSDQIVLTTTGHEKIITAQKIFRVRTQEELFSSFFRVQNVSTNVNCTELIAGNGSCYMSWSDTTGILEEANLQVYRINSGGKRLVYNETVSSPSGSMTYLIINATEGDRYEAYGYVDTTTENSIYAVGAAFTESIQTLRNTFGLFLNFFFLLLFVVIMYYALEYGLGGILVGIILSLILGTIFGIWNLATGALFTLIIIIAIILGRGKT